MNRKAQSEELLAKLPLYLLIIVILFWGVIAFTKILSDRGESLSCEASFLASSVKPLGMDPECKTRRLVLSVDDEGETAAGSEIIALNKEMGSTLNADRNVPWPTFDRVVWWNLNPGFPNKFPYLDEFPSIMNGLGTDPDPEKLSADMRTAITRANADEENYVRIRYNMDQVIADEMQRCWDIVGNGDLDLFDKWATFFDCGDGPCGDDFSFDDLLDVNGLSTYANFCVLCSRIKFDDSFSTFPEDGNPDNYDFESDFDSINVWLANHPWQFEMKSSYYEYIMDDDQEVSMTTRPRFHYSLDEPLAVYFVRINAQGLAVPVVGGYNFLNDKLPVWLGGGGEDIRFANVIVLSPYSEVSQNCHYIVSSEI